MTSRKTSRVILPAGRARDRAATEKALLEAAKQLLAEQGFKNLGINAIARRAGYDKQLVYRYFGGLEGLFDAIGADLATWVSDHLEAPEQQSPAANYADLMQRFAIAYMRALRSDALMQKIVAWEISEASPHVRVLTDARSRGLTAWMAKVKGDLVPPVEVDAPAINAVVIAAIQHLVLTAAVSKQFAGMPLSRNSDWQRLEASIQMLLRAMYK